MSFFLCLTGELTKNLIGLWLLTIPTYSFHDNAPSHSRFSGCLVQKARFCEKTWMHIIWNISWAWNNRPYSCVNWQMCLLKVSLCSQCDPFCSKFPWALSCLIVLIFFQNYGVGCCNLSTILTFVCARVHPNQHLMVFRARHFHTNARASFDRPKNISLIGPILLPGLILRSKHPPITLVGLSASPQGVKSIPELFLGGLVWRYCLISRFSALSAFLRSQTNSLSFVAFALSTTASVVYLLGISRRFSSAARAMLPNQSRSTVDARAERFPFAIQA